MIPSKMAVLWPGRDSGRLGGSLLSDLSKDLSLEAVVGEQIKKPMLVSCSDSQRQCDL